MDLFSLEDDEYEHMFLTQSAERNNTGISDNNSAKLENCNGGEQEGDSMLVETPVYEDISDEENFMGNYEPNFQ